MKYKIRQLPQANRDIMRLLEVLAPYPNKAKRIFQEMDRKLKQLEDNPLMCAAYHAKPKYRRMNLEDHALFYTVDEDKHEVVVCAVIYARRNMAGMLED